MNVSVIGLGKLGLCTAACFASKGHKVIGVDADLGVVKALCARQSPIEETGLRQLLESAWTNLEVTADVEYAVCASEVTLIVVPTPSEPDGRFTNRHVVDVLTAVGPALRKKDGFRVVGVVSTVMPGSCEDVFMPLLEELSGKACGTDFGLVYNPEFIALGSVISNFLNPDVVLIGASDDLSAGLMAELYRTTCENAPHVAVMSLVNAEITKLSLNCFVTMKISFANELASLCERVRGADVDVVTSALGHDTRIGSRCLKAGLGFGGPCFPRDNLALQALAREVGVKARLGPAVVAVNSDVLERLMALVAGGVKAGARVAVLGLAYKPGTHIVEESHALMLAQRLARAGYDVHVHDPVALESARKVLGKGVACHEDAYECVRGASAVVLATNWPEFAQLDWTRVGRLAGRDAIVVDCWRTLRGKEAAGLTRVELGCGSECVFSLASLTT